MSNTIYHYGIKGQKWGIRRFQNSDGSLTNAGKKRYSEDPSYTEAHSKKPVSQMSNEELKRRNARLNLEKQYNDLTRQKSDAKKVIDAFVKGGATISAIFAAYGGYKKAANSLAPIVKPIVEKAGNLAINELLAKGLL